MEILNYLIGLLISFALGIVTSFVFGYLNLLIRPKISISNVVARSDAGAPIVKVKVANNSAYPAVDVRAELHRVRKGAQSGRLTTHRIPLVRDDPLWIDRRGHVGNADLYVFTSRMQTDAGTIDDTMALYRESTLRFRLIVTHPVSNVKKVFEKEYDWETDVKYGDFSAGRPIDQLAI